MNKVVESPARMVTVQAMPARRKVESGASPSFNAVDHEDDARRLDAVAGSEFLDDRIRSELLDVTT